jgi:hypothetical protein
MPDPVVARWKQKGRVHLWRYKQPSRNNSGWHLAADEAGCDSVLQLLELMANARWPGRQSIMVSAPEERMTVGVAPPGKGRTWLAPQEWLLHHPKGAVADDHWQWTATETQAVLAVGLARLRELALVVSSPISRGS